MSKFELVGSTVACAVAGDNLPSLCGRGILDADPSLGLQEIIKQVRESNPMKSAMYDAGAALSQAPLNNIVLSDAQETSRPLGPNGPSNGMAIG